MGGKSQENAESFKDRISKLNLNVLKTELARTDEEWKLQLLQQRIDSVLEKRKQKDKREQRRQRYKQMSPKQVFDDSDPRATQVLHDRLESCGFQGRLASELFRALKASKRAKDYRGGIDAGGSKISYRGLSYERKDEALIGLCVLLADNDTGFVWGWGEDPEEPRHKHVLYVDLPTGQISFHSESRKKGPDYPGEWDGARRSTERILAFCEQVLAQEGQEAGESGE